MRRGRVVAKSSGRGVGAVAALTAWAALLTGCPPTGDVPPFNPVLLDAAPSEAGPVDATPPTDVGPDLEPDAAPDPCADLDDDGYVVGTGCALPGGDCAPEDASRNPGAAETCNLRDDDCDGVTDEGDPGGGAECLTDQLGICAAGRTACRQGSLACEPIERRALAETCNGLDDDCDGTTDEQVPGLGDVCQTGEPGVCARGARACVEGAVRCVAAVAAGAERCNGLDDDCDGTPDEGDPDGGGACNTALLGACQVGVLRCTGGEATCTQSVEPAAETCNGLDDDCDGRTDETFPTLGEACAVGVGACARQSTRVCTGDGLGVECDATAGNGVPERCNGLDDDCDGTADEGYALGEACQNGLGACRRPGLTVCDPNELAVVCGAEPGESFDERCNGLDDDCDGATDELFPTLGQACVDASGQCPSPGLLACAANGLGVACAAEPVLPVPERCNDFDDDCDGRVDEAFPAKGAACAVGVGACARSGRQVCTEAGELACSVVAGAPVAERCNGLDDDCDGRVDEGAPCPGAPAGGVVALRVAPVGSLDCADLNGDGSPDNAFEGLANRLDGRLAAAFTAGQRALVVRAPGAPADGFALEFLEATAGPDGAPRARADSLLPGGQGRERLTGFRLEGPALAGGDPGALRLPSPLLYAPALGAARQVQLAGARVAGPLAVAPLAGADNDALGLTANDLVLSAHLDRADLLAAYAEADAACAAAAVPPAASPPADCAGRLTPAELAAALVADVDADGDGTRESVSLCLRLDLAPVGGAASPPVGPIACVADADCFAGLVCRPVPWTAANPALGTALARRCAAPGTGDRPVGAACDAHDDCRLGLCLAATAASGICADLCADDGDCGAGLACRGVAAEVEGAVTAGGQTARACVAVTGSGQACGATGSCPGAEVCAPFFGGAVGVAGGAVNLAPRCHAPTLGGAALGAACAHDLDCVRGLGCVPDLEGAGVCAPTCTGGSQCSDDRLCTARPVLVAPDATLSHGFCVAVPAALGSGRRCAAAADCAPTETCRADFLAPAGAPDAFCGLAAGFFAVGQPCTTGGDCASGACDAGHCTGPCQTPDQCGPTQTCRADGWRDPVSDAPAAACGPVAGACVFDRDCNDRDAACAGDRCVCEANRCRLGCRAGGSCLDGDACQADGTCTPFCRVDRAEPDDTPAQALRLDLGRAQPAVELEAWLCATSAVDHYRFTANGRPFTARATPRLAPLSGAAPPVRVEIALLDDAGAVLAVTAAGDADDPAGPVQVALNAAAASAQAGRDLWVRVRAAGTFGALSYVLNLDLAPDGCADPDADEPTDEPWQVTELLATPGLNAQSETDAAICPADTDWYGVYLGNGDTLRVQVDALGNGVGAPDGLQVDLVGPDWPALPGATTRAGLPLGETFTFTPPTSTCDAATLFCRLDDGTPTEVFCGNNAAQCDGIGWFLRVRGAGPLHQAAYRLTAEVDRARDLACVPDLHEHDDNFQFLERIYAATGPQNITDIQGNLTLPLTRQVNILGRRACGADGLASVAEDADNLMLFARRGETLRMGVFKDDAIQNLQLDVYDARGEIVRLSAEVFSQPTFIADHVTQFDGYHGIGVLRAQNEGTPGYAYQVPYALALLRLPFGHTVDEGCAAPTRLTLVNNRADTSGSLLGAEDDHRPLGCTGGRGPDRVFVVRVPAGGGVLRATVTALDGTTDPEVALRGTCDVPNSELACNADDLTAPDPLDRALAQAVVQGGANGRDYFVYVDSHDAESAGAFRLDLRYLTAAECNLATGVCNDPCANVVCPQGRFCDTNDGACITCLVDNQCNPGSRCLNRQCVAGADRSISDWGVDGQDEPECVNQATCTADETCLTLPFNGGKFCAMGCGAALACPVGFECCNPIAPLPSFGVPPSCLDARHPYRASLCTP